MFTPYAPKESEIKIVKFMLLKCYISEVTKSHPKDDDDIKFSID